MSNLLRDRANRLRRLGKVVTLVGGIGITVSAVWLLTVLLGEGRIIARDVGAPNPLPALILLAVSLMITSVGVVIVRRSSQRY